MLGFTPKKRQHRTPRHWEDRQLLAGYDSRSLVELQAIIDRSQSQIDAQRAGLARSS
jgi:hypothetical protein